MLLKLTNFFILITPAIASAATSGGFKTLMLDLKPHKW